MVLFLSESSSVQLLDTGILKNLDQADTKHEIKLIEIKPKFGLLTQRVSFRVCAALDLFEQYEPIGKITLSLSRQAYFIAISFLRNWIV